MGGTICTLSHPVNYDSSMTLEENIQRLRDEITPLFSDIVKSTIVKKKLEKIWKHFWTRNYLGVHLETNKNHLFNFH